MRFACIKIKTLSRVELKTRLSDILHSGKNKKKKPLLKEQEEVELKSGNSLG